MKELNLISERVLEGKRLTAEEALFLYENGDIYLLGSFANTIRKKIHSHKIVTYVIDRNINYSNICVSGCKFCAFFRSPDHPEGYVLSKEELAQKIEETKSLNGTQVLLQGGLHPGLSLDFYEDMLSFIKELGVHAHALSPPEIVYLSKQSGIPIKELLKRLIEAGLDSIPGGGAEILVDRVRKKISPNKASSKEWLSVMETAHELGLKTTATMMFGHIETLEERVEHLIKLRQLQDKTHGFTAFIPWTFQSVNTALNIPTATSHEYLQLLAISRVVLDNFPNIQTSWVTQGPKIAQLSLFFGANDFGSTMIEENVVAATGVSHSLSEDEIRRLIQEAGFIPSQRFMDYSLVDEGD